MNAFKSNHISVRHHTSVLELKRLVAISFDGLSLYTRLCLQMSLSHQLLISNGQWKRHEESYSWFDGYSESCGSNTFLRNDARVVDPVAILPRLVTWMVKVLSLLRKKDFGNCICSGRCLHGEIILALHVPQQKVDLIQSAFFNLFWIYLDFLDLPICICGKLVVIIDFLPLLNGIDIERSLKKVSRPLCGGVSISQLLLSRLIF